MDELKLRIQCAKERIDIIGMTEVYPKNCRFKLGKAELNLEGYDLFINDQDSDKVRGTALYIRKELKSEEVKLTTELKE
eukprot:gene18392-20244_t